MSLKIVTTLIVAGLVAQSKGYVLKGLRPYFKPVPGFSYTSEKNADHDELSISAKEGRLMFWSYSHNLTAWSLHQVNGSSTISQKTSYPFFSVVYYDVQASAGDATYDDGSVHANLATSTFDTSLTATKNDTKCALAGKVTKSEAGIELMTYRVDDAFDAEAVVDDLKAAIWGMSVDGVLATFTESLMENLRKFDTKALCEQILAATPGNVPEPELND